MEIIAIWAFFAVLVGVLGASFGRNGFGWFLLSLLLSPIIGAIALLIVGRAVTEESRAGRRSQIQCPECKERILSDARVCKHCGHRLLPAETPQMVADREGRERKRLLKRRVIGFSLIAVMVYIGYTAS